MKKIIKKIAGLLAAAVLVLGISGCKPEVHVHKEGSDTVITEPTCMTTGSKTYTCTACGKVVTEKISALGFCEKPVDAETFKSATASSTYIYFGVFPKDIVYQNDGKLYLADKTTELTIDENDKVTMGANTYYKGSDGEYYTKITTTSSWGKCTDGDYTSSGTERYFKMEPIKWKVLTTEYDIDGTSGTKTGALLLAEDALIGNVPYYKYNSYSNTRTVDGVSGIYHNNYKYSQVRAWLNGLDYYYDTSASETTKVETYNSKGLLQTAFTASAQNLINTTTVDNGAASTTDAGSYLTKATSYYCADTEDKIFLLSEQEVTTADYGFPVCQSYGEGNTRIRVPTDYALANNAHLANIDEEGKETYGGWLWLRSPSNYDKAFVRYVDEDGCASRGPSEDAWTFTYYTDYGVVPALTLSLQ